MNFYQRVSTMLALCLYFPLGWQLLTGQVTQNLATWLLWGTLDAIAAASLFKQKGNWHLPAAYVGGCAFTIVCMLKARRFEWTWFETAISIMVIVCLLGWYKSGPRLATILSTIGVVLGGIPQLKDAYLTPAKMPLAVYFGFTLVNALSTMGGKDWSVEERLYPLACTVLCVFIVGTTLVLR